MMWYRNGGDSISKAAPAYAARKSRATDVCRTWWQREFHTEFLFKQFVDGKGPIYFQPDPTPAIVPADLHVH